jgi:hypothetical protein
MGVCGSVAIRHDLAIVSVTDGTSPEGTVPTLVQRLRVEVIRNLRALGMTVREIRQLAAL